MECKHIVLLGDSIFDNAGYVDKGDSVIEKLREKSPASTKASLLAVDGDVTKDVYAQLERLPDDTSHLILSCGGNDALRTAGILNQSVGSVGDAMDMLAEMKEEFEIIYSNLLATVYKCNQKVAVCTIYDSVPNYSKRALAALVLFNEVILRQAFKFKAPVIDLRLACNESRDYSHISPIEPSKHGSMKITDLILRVVEEHPFGLKPSSIYF